MKTNILNAINSIIENQIYSIDKYKSLSYKIRINNMGEPLENLIKDALCGNFDLEADKRIEVQNEYFSYRGNQNNPPDLIIRGGDAFEVKKIGSNEGDIPLNSSFPKDKLYRNSSMITNACKNCEEDWSEKDICYIIGRIDDKSAEKRIKSLWFIYGDCYCAKPEIYAGLMDKITNGIKELGIELSNTNEIAKVKKVDPLGITDLRVLGMWGIKHPSKVFDYITTRDTNPYIKALMLKKKFDAFDETSRANLAEKCDIKNVKIQDPNNPANLLDAVLIEHEFKS
jgi:hypothetical protein